MLPNEALGILHLSYPMTKAEAKKAYGALVKEHKPERDPEGFQRIREAWETIEAWLSDESGTDSSFEVFPHGIGGFDLMDFEAATEAPPEVRLETPPGETAPPSGEARTETGAAEAEASEAHIETGIASDPLWKLFSSWMAATRAKTRRPREAAFALLEAAFGDIDASSAMPAQAIHAWRIARETQGIWSELLDAEVEYCLLLTEWAYKSAILADLPAIPKSLFKLDTQELLEKRAPLIRAEQLREIAATVHAFSPDIDLWEGRPRAKAEPNEENPLVAITGVAFLLFLIGIGIVIGLSHSSNQVTPPSSAPSARKPPMDIGLPSPQALKEGLDPTQFDVFLVDELQAARGDEEAVKAIRLKLFERFLKRKLAYDAKGRIIEAERSEDGNDTGD